MLQYNMNVEKKDRKDNIEDFLPHPYEWRIFNNDMKLDVKPDTAKQVLHYLPVLPAFVQMLVMSVKTDLEIISAL